MLRAVLIVLVLAAFYALVGCVAEVEPATPVGYAEVTYAPMPVAEMDIESYPHTWYESRPVYLVNGRWWYRDGSRWAYYVREPMHLQRTRHYVQEAPPAVRVERPVRRVEEAPPASAPPAVRVR